MVSRSRAHLREAGETYFGHMRFAATVAAMMVLGGLACLVHALVPGLCTRTASGTIARLHRIMQDRAQLEQAEGRGEAAAFGWLVLLSLGTSAGLWLAGTQPFLAAPLTLLALAFPVAFIVTQSEGAAELR